MPSNKITVCLKPVLPQSLSIHVYIKPLSCLDGILSLGPFKNSTCLFVHLLACLLVYFSFFKKLLCHYLLEHYDIPFNSGLKL